MRAISATVSVVLLVAGLGAQVPGNSAEKAFLVVGTVVDSEAAPVADKTVYLFPVRAGRLTMTLKVEGSVATCCADPSAKTDKQGKFTIEVPKEVLRNSRELTIGVPEDPPRALSRDDKPLVFRVVDRSTGKLDLGTLTLYCPNCSPW